MTSKDQIGDNPFLDPGVHQAPLTEPDASTLVVGRNASLTLGTDSLIVLDEAFTRQEPRCCGLPVNLIHQNPKTTKAIPFSHLLWAELLDYEIVLHYAHPTSKAAVRAACLQYLVEKPSQTHARAWIARLLDRAYGAAQRQKRIKVLINPASGNGSAQKVFTRDVEPIFAAARCKMSVERTQFRGHAGEIAEKLDVEAFDVVAACSGDGLPYEIFNGLGRRKADARHALRKLAVAQLPAGSGNAMSWNLYGTDSNSLAALAIVKGLRMPMDLVSVTHGNTRTLSFLSQSAGIVAESDLATEHLRWMGGARFTWGFLVRLAGKTVYPCDLAVKLEVGSKAAIREHWRRKRHQGGEGEARGGGSQSQEAGSSEEEEEEEEDLLSHGDDDDHGARRPPPPPRREPDGPGLPPLRYGTVNDPLPPGWTLVPHDKLGNFYAGNMVYIAAGSPFFPAALPADGCMDLVTVDGDIPRAAALGTMFAMEKGTFFDLPHVTYQKISGYRIIPKGQEDGYISVDGERVPFGPLQAEVHPGLGTVVGRRGWGYEIAGKVGGGWGGDGVF